MKIIFDDHFDLYKKASIAQAAVAAGSPGGKPAFRVYENSGEIFIAKYNKASITIYKHGNNNDV